MYFKRLVIPQPFNNFSLQSYHLVQQFFTSFSLGHMSQSYKAVKLTFFFCLFFLAMLYANELSNLLFLSLISEESQR